MSGDEPERFDVVIIGAGIAGLAAAGELARSGRRVCMLEKSRGLGGRMATRRLGNAVCDHGAQFFTVRGRAFGGIVADALAAGSVTKWCDGFSAAGDGHPRWRGSRAMTDLPKWLASELPETSCVVRCGARVSAIGVAGTRVAVSVEEGRGIEAAGAVVTAPVPQALDLMAAGGLMVGSSPAIDPQALRTLSAIDYDPCFALMVVLDRPSRVPPPGGMQFEREGPASGPIAWLADNQQKGISFVPALTIHATGAFSRRYFDAPQDDVAGMLLDATQPWIEGPVSSAVVEWSLHRWKFAQPTTIVPTPLVAATIQPPIVCCGDAFAGPKVEGAASSGLAAGRWLGRVLGGD